MSVKQTAKRIYSRIIDDASVRYQDHRQPKEGWLTTIRKALGMSGPQMAKRAGVTKAAIYQAERKELVGEITIKQLEKYAASMGGKLVYAIVPKPEQDTQHSRPSKSGTVAELVRQQAIKKAKALVGTAHTHMALESQALSDEANKAEIMHLAHELERNPPSDFWDEE